MAKQLIDPADKFSCQKHVVEETAPGVGTYKGIWEEADVIYAYTRQQAIEDGVLVDLMQPGLVELVHNAGIKFPVAMTAEAFSDYVELTPMAKGLQRHQRAPLGRPVDVRSGSSEISRGR